MRVHELAKELQTDTKTLTGVLAGIDIVIKTHFAVLTDEQADKVRGIYASGSVPAPQVSKKPPRKRAPKSAKKERAPEVEVEAPAAEAPKVVVIETAGEAPKTVIEQRMSGTVIRRRKKSEPEPVAPVEIDEPVSSGETESAAAPEPDALPPQDAELTDSGVSSSSVAETAIAD